MIRVITDPEEQNRAFARAKRFVGDDEHLLATDWLGQPEVFCLAEENENHGVHHDDGSLKGALECFPDDNWRTAEIVNRNRILDPLEVPSPAFQTIFDPTGIQLASHYNGRGFMLFSMENDAVILYSPEYEYKLVAGSAAFVRTYFENAVEDPIVELRSLSSHNIDWWKRQGVGSQALAIQDGLETALSHVNLPPPPPPQSRE
ncbi:hypothetical protein G7068_04550 [Leucobacter viscericola]|uniref:Uncharacterized protein n=1 Tax=Leucobacter viscericola TaxID=2714935 RepID=A0A6G7XDN8_9MICO|nr:hypothetical protein [Leucobacter viscericola]QIK62559.1 hypothetical protein G7068_04550 [Leucobacter viscericola]